MGSFGDHGDKVYGDVNASIDSMPAIDFSYDTKLFLTTLVLMALHPTVEIDETKTLAEDILKQIEKE